MIERGSLEFEENLSRLEPLLGRQGEKLRYFYSDLYDLSSLKEHPCSDLTHKKCFGYMKLENGGKPVDYFCAPVLKGYIEQIGNKKAKITLKGVPKKQRDELTKEDFENSVLLLKSAPKVSFLSFSIPKEHGVNTTLVTKDSFKFFQPKICVMPPDDENYGYDGQDYLVSCSWKSKYT